MSKPQASIKGQLYVYLYWFLTTKLAPLREGEIQLKSSGLNV